MIISDTHASYFEIDPQGAIDTVLVTVHEQGHGAATVAISFTELEHTIDRLRVLLEDLDAARNARAIQAWKDLTPEEREARWMTLDELDTFE